MKHKSILAVSSLALLLALIVSAPGAEPAKPDTAGKPNADAILKKMSDTLGKLDHFSFKATREVLPAVAAVHMLPASSDIEVTVQRPNKVTGNSTAKDDQRTLCFDGEKLSIFIAKENMYAVFPLKASLDALPGELAEKLGLVPPLADFIISDPYKDIKFRAKTISYVGTESAGTPAEDCYHLKLSGKLADSDLWIGVSDNLPKKFTASLKAQAKAETDLTIQFTEWNTDASVAASTFVFTPPAGAQEIPMLTVAEANSKTKKTK